MSAKKNFNNEAEKEATIPISSLIDVVFLLVMFFVVTAAIDLENIDNEIILAKAKDLEALEKRPIDTVRVGITEDGRYKVKGIVYTKEGVINLAKDNKDFQLVILVDEDTIYEHVDKLLQTLVELSITAVSISVESKK